MHLIHGTSLLSTPLPLWTFIISDTYWQKSFPDLCKSFIKIENSNLVIWNGYFREWTFWIPRDAQKQHHFKPLVNSPGSDNIGKLEISFYLFVATGVWNSRAILQSIKPLGIAICKTMSTTTVQITLQIIPFGFYTSIILVLKNGGIIVSVRLFSFYFRG